MAKQNLTYRALKALRSRALRYEIMDTVVPGFGIRVSEHGTKIFILVARFGGSKNPTRRALGEYGTIELADARTKARKWIELIHRGIDPAVEEERERLIEQRKAATTFRSVAEDFIAEKASKERRGDEAERIVRRELLPAWADRPIADITALDVVLLLKPIKARGEFMAHNALALVKRLFGWAVDSRIYGLESSPADRLKAARLIGEKSPRTRVLNNDEIRALWRACVRMRYPHGDLVRFILLSAARHFEAAQAPWSEFDLARAEWMIDQARFKSNSTHIVPLTGAAVDLLNSLPRYRGGTFLFSTTFGKIPTKISGKIKDQIDTRMLRTLRAMARMRGEDFGNIEFKPWTIHDLRRVVRTHLAALRIPDHVAEMILGHRKKGLQRVYDQHSHSVEMREALEAWAARLRDIVTPPPANVVAIRRVP